MISRPPFGWLPLSVGLYALLGGTLALLGWMLDVPGLADWDSDGIAMQPNTGVAAILTGIAFILQSRWPGKGIDWLATIIIAIGAGTLLEHASGFDLGIDRILLFERPWGTRGTVTPGRMGVPSAISWTLIGFALFALHRDGTRSIHAPVCGLTVMVLSALSITGYLFGADLLYSLPRLTAIAFQTSTILLAAGAALVGVAVDRQPAKLLIGQAAANHLLRRVLPVIVLVPVLFGYVCVRGYLLRLYDAPMGVALLVVAVISSLIGVFWWCAKVLVDREESLRRSELKFARFMENLPGLAWIKDRTGRYLYANRAAEQAFSRPRAELYGKTDDEIFDQATAAAFRSNDREAVCSPDGLQIVETLQHDDGVIHHSLVNKFLVSAGAEDGELIGGIAIDITERKRAEDTVESLLRISSRLNSTLSVDDLLDGLVQEARDLVGAEAGVAGLKTAEGMVCDKYFQKDKVLSLAYCWPPMHGLPGWLIVHKRPYLTNDAQRDPQIVQELCERFGVWSALSTPIVSPTGDVLGFFEIHNKKDGSGFTVVDQQTLLAVSQIAAIAVQNALAYRSLQAAESSLKQADRRKDEFLATLAHELRNPLAPIRTGLELIKLADGDEHLAEEARDMMERQVAHMVRLVDDLLDVSRITLGKLKLRKQPIDLSSVINGAIEAARPFIDGAGHKLTVAMPAVPLCLDADSARLTQVFSNLLHNASKFTPQDGEISLAVERREEELIVTVRDNGIGIPGAHLQDIFEMFSQVTPAMERSHGGLGLGLSLVKRIVELHHGTVEARSPGLEQGSEFIVRLPAGRPLLPIPEKRDADSSSSPPRSASRILVVDDNRDAANSVATMLQLMGHTTYKAFDGLEAIETAAKLEPDIILLDIGLPKLNGYETARRIRSESWGQETLLIALTGWGQEEDQRRSADAGFDLHLVKPVDGDDLRKALTRRERRRTGRTLSAD